MKNTPKSFITIVVLLLTSALLLAACAGQAAVEADASAQGEVGAGSEAEVQADASAEAGVSADQGGAADTANEAQADVETETEAEVAVEAFPDLVLGSAELHASNPAAVTLASGEIQFIEFFAYWCANCKAMAPHVHGLEQLYGDRVNFVYLDRDDPATAELQAQLGYVYQPHIFILDGEGNILFQSVYFTEATVLQEAIEAALASN